MKNTKSIREKTCHMQSKNRKYNGLKKEKYLRKLLLLTVTLQRVVHFTLPSAEDLEKDMATDSSVLAWRIPWTEEPGWSSVHGVAKSPT